MLNIQSKSRQSGFTLTELMVGIVIMAVLAAIAAPNLQSMMRNSQIRNAAESITNGLQRARAEAVARNTNVAFTLTADSSWSVNVLAPASIIESRPGSEGSANVTLTIAPAGTTTITFNNFGGVQATNANGTAPLTQVDLASTGGNQSLRVTIGIGGNARMCDPNLTSGSSPRAC